ncbi:MAG: hypothetical protein FJ399_19100, partial [Verrucomicrobia bacterium]|nr:hypothetical protein [Verrucomicrobiota bacterium]
VYGAITDGVGANTLGVIKSGRGTWTLHGDHAWSGATNVSGGTLLVHGRLAGTGTVTVASGATLGGNGTLAGAVRVQAGGRLAPGASIGTLTITAALTLAAGSTTAVEIDPATGACDRLAGLASLTCGGTLAITPLAGTFRAGQSFPLFSAAQMSGNFSAISPAAPGPGLAWDFDPASGVLRVLATGAGGDARIANLSVLTTLTADEPALVVGTVVGGAGPAGAKPLLVRAAGPSLTPLGVTGVLPDPRLELYAGGRVLATNDDWGGTAALRTAFAGAGAFAFASDASQDAALLRTGADALPPGDYAVHVRGTAGSSGAVLLEIYEAGSGEASTTSPRLINVAVLKAVPAGTTLTAGFVLTGSASLRVLVRAVGPALRAAPFNVAGAMLDPRIELFRGSAAIGGNDNWGGGLELATTFARTGAFALPTESRDAALVATLAPGAYTAQVIGVGTAAGVVLVEVYEVP